MLAFKRQCDSAFFSSREGSTEFSQRSEKTLVNNFLSAPERDSFFSSREGSTEFSQRSEKTLVNNFLSAPERDSFFSSREGLKR
jgi:hypothetical protein